MKVLVGSSGGDLNVRDEPVWFIFCSPNHKVALAGTWMVIVAGDGPAGCVGAGVAPAGGAAGGVEGNAGGVEGGSSGSRDSGALAAPGGISGCLGSTGGASSSFSGGG